ncbi:MAG: GNAT family N-acetyltransferase [Actinomycetota bacterium]
MMRQSNLAGAYELRGYRDGDEDEVITLLATSLGDGPTGERSRAFFRWKHIDNPFGRSFMLVAVEDERVVGFRSFMRWRLRAGDVEVSAARAVDTATHPDHQGRGIFSALTSRAMEELSGDVDLIFNTPNGKSGPGYLKMGWTRAGDVPIDVRVRHPIRFARGARSFREQGPPRRPHPRVYALPAGAAFEDEGALVCLLRESSNHGERLATPRTVDYLRWRYASAPGLDYRVGRHHLAGRLAGLAFFRVRSRGRLWESTVSELICRPGDGRTARRLLGEVVRAAGVDHLTGHFPTGTVQKKVSTRLGFVRSPAGLPFMVNRLRTADQPDPAHLRSWALTLGDLEVF